MPPFTNNLIKESFYYGVALYGIQRRDIEHGSNRCSICRLPFIGRCLGCRGRTHIKGWFADWLNFLLQVNLQVR